MGIRSILTKDRKTHRKGRGVQVQPHHGALQLVTQDNRASHDYQLELALLTPLNINLTAALVETLVRSYQLSEQRRGRAGATGVATTFIVDGDEAPFIKAEPLPPASVSPSTRMRGGSRSIRTPASSASSSGSEPGRSTASTKALALLMPSCSIEARSHLGGSAGASAGPCSKFDYTSIHAL